MGICHSYAPDGRCISLLKILLTNFCIYDCSYCINRSSSNVRRARFTRRRSGAADHRLLPRNYIEGLFLSSGIIRSPDETMEEMVRGRAPAARGRKFRRLYPSEDDPGCSPELIEEAGRYADRLSINIELPTDEGVKRLAPEKKPDDDPAVDGDAALQDRGEVASRREDRQARSASRRPASRRR